MFRQSVFTVAHLTGAMEQGEIGMLKGLLEELSQADAEHADISVEHESGWCLSVFPSKHVVLENVESGESPRSAYLSTFNDCLLAMQAVAQGRIDDLDAISWEDGYGNE